MITVPKILITALIAVESGGNDHAVGVNGELGCLQISRARVDEVNAINRRTSGAALLSFSHKDARQRLIAESICRVYIGYYAAFNRLNRRASLEDMARIWNGGPEGHRKVETKAYWRKVRAELLRIDPQLAVCIASGYVIESADAAGGMSPDEFMQLALRTAPEPGSTAVGLDTPEVVDLLHGAVGICTEMGELMEAYEGNQFRLLRMDTVNLIEECGDVLWYVAVVARGFRLRMSDLETNPLGSVPLSQVQCVMLATVEGARLLDVTKKYLFYGQRYSPAAVKLSCARIVAYLSTLLAHNSFTLADAWDRNVAKLHARYPGKYTPERAIHRDPAAERAALEHSTP